MMLSMAGEDAGWGAPVEAAFTENAPAPDLSQKPKKHHKNMSLTEVKSKCTGWDVPVVSPGWLQLVLGVLNCFLFGVGVMIAGALNNNLVDVVIGILQLCIPFVGWIWAVIWGVLMVLKAVK